MREHDAGIQTNSGLIPILLDAIGPRGGGAFIMNTSPTCLADCEEVGYDDCVAETRALVACVDRAQGGDCSVDPNIPCEAEGDAWSACP